MQQDPTLAGPILEGRPHLLAEAVHAARNELALHVEDVLYRRTRVGLESRDGTEEAARRVAGVLAREFDWGDDDVEREIERALAFRAPDDEAVHRLARGGAGAG